MSFYKVKKTSQLREMNSEQLRERLKDIAETQMIMAANRVSRGAVNPGQWRNIKKEKARILTILAERKNPGKGGFRKR